MVWCRLYGCNVCGEGGEYETVVLDCPLFTRARIVLQEWQSVLHSPDSVAPVAVLHPTRFSLERKQDAGKAATPGHAPDIIVVPAGMCCADAGLQQVAVKQLKSVVASRRLTSTGGQERCCAVVSDYRCPPRDRKRAVYSGAADVDVRVQHGSNMTLVACIPRVPPADGCSPAVTQGALAHALTSLEASKVLGPSGQHVCHAAQTNSFQIT